MIVILDSLLYITLKKYIHAGRESIKEVYFKVRTASGFYIPLVLCWMSVTQSNQLHTGYCLPRATKQSAHNNTARRDMCRYRRVVPRQRIVVGVVYWTDVQGAYYRGCGPLKSTRRHGPF